MSDVQTASNFRCSAPVDLRRATELAPCDYDDFTQLAPLRNVLSLTEAIRKMTSLPAARLGWKDRGVVKKNAIADLVIFDPKTIADKATFADPHRHSVGVDTVIVRGRRVLSNGKMTGELPGRPVGLGDR